MQFTGEVQEQELLIDMRVHGTELAAIESIESGPDEWVRMMSGTVRFKLQLLPLLSAIMRLL